LGAKSKTVTLILALANRDHVIQLSDRRLTSNRILVDDESNKAGTFICNGVRAVYGFTGLVRYDGFETSFWLNNALYECALPDFHFPNMMQRLQERANRDFANIPQLLALAPADREVSVLFSGFLDHEAPPRAFFFVMSNAERHRAMVAPPKDGFVFITSREKRPYDAEFTLVQRVGNWLPMTTKDEDVLRAMLAEHRPAHAIVGKAVEVIQDIADRPSASGTIGKQISSIVLPRKPGSPVTTQFHSNTISFQSYMPDTVFALGPGRHSATYGAAITAIAQPGRRAIAVPKVGANQRCPCGSGKKYKNCHGRH
jgi:hypothetical protein